MNPAPPQRPKLFDFGGNSKGIRVVLVLAGLFLLLVLFVVLKGVFGGKNTAIPAMVSVAQEQQVLAHLATEGTQNATSGSMKNFAYTTQLSLASQQRQTVNYLKANHHKTGSKELNLKVSKSTDAQLASALSASNYDPVFKSVMRNELKTYQNTLTEAYKQVAGPKGRALLSADYDAVQLLAKQLSD